MGINKKILKIIERCTSEMDETAKFKGMLTDDCLKFKEPVSLEKLKELRLSVIITEAGASQRSAQLAGRLVENVHRAEAACVLSDNFI